MSSTQHHSKRSYPRHVQVSDVVHRELAMILREEMSDPRLRVATVLSVSITSDFKWADVTITAPTEEEQNQAVATLNHASGRLRYCLSQKLRNMRGMPRLRFKGDRGWVHEERIRQLLKQAAN